MTVDNPIRMTRRAFGLLPEYSTTLPTGQTEGKRWKRDAWLDGREWWQGRYGKTVANPDERARRRAPEVILIHWRRIIIQGAPPQWPREILVSPRGAR